MRKTDAEFAKLMADASDEAWSNRMATDPRMSALINLARGGRLSFESLASAMFSFGWIQGYGAGWTAREATMGKTRDD